MPKLDKRLKLDYRIVVCAMVINYLTTICLPYREITEQAISLGYPFVWLKIYDIHSSSYFLNVSHTNILAVALNIGVYYLIIKGIYAPYLKYIRKNKKE